jgi:hypothetical protein
MGNTGRENKGVHYLRGNSPAMDKIAEFFANLFNKLSAMSKLVTIAFVCLIFYWIDTQMGFTYHYFTGRKIEEIKKYSEIITSPSVDSVTKVLLVRERTNVIQKSRATFDRAVNKKDKSFLFHLSYSFAFAILMILAYPLLKNQSPYEEKSKLRAQAIGVVIILGIECLMCYLLGSGLSQYVSGYLLYFFNLFMQIFLLYLTFKYVPKLSTS